jgi:phosphoribosylaminoimidazolecarboxamide formyltransferase/IMP cyclohydrolase
LVDADAAWSAIQRFTAPTVGIVKHTVPCGLACRDSLADAFSCALDGDLVSAFGGIVALNRPLDVPTAQRIADVFFEVIIAPQFEADALDILVRKKQIRLLQLGTSAPASGDHQFEVQPMPGGMLVQDKDLAPDDESTWKVATERAPTNTEYRDLRFAWEVVRHVKSNAIVLAKDESVVGVGAGQPNRVESVCIAVKKAGDKSLGAALASDAFIPFADGLEEAIRAGVTAAIQPGGSIRDDKVIAAADAAGIAMIFTGVRHFKH